VVKRPDDELSTLNYGFDRLRLLSPVVAGARICGEFVLDELTLRSPTQFRCVLGTQVLIEAQSKPALVAKWLVLTNVKTPRTASPLTGP
jgi:acyl dehydratase